MMIRQIIRQRPLLWSTNSVRLLSTNQHFDAYAAVLSPKITMVKKKLADGRVDANSEAVLEKMKSDGSFDQINSFVYADVKDLNAPGWELAAQHKVDTAPFFVVEDGHDTKIFTIYQALKSEILK